MTKLMNLEPFRLKTLVRVVGGGSASPDRLGRNAPSWRGWYKTARWEKVRQAAFLRDRWTCQRSGELCLGRGQEPNAPVANHKIPHRGDPQLFWSLDNIETVTKRVHDSLIKAEENARALDYRRMRDAHAARSR